MNGQHREEAKIAFKAMADRKLSADEFAEL